jgi:hypothetical protein
MRYHLTCHSVHLGQAVALLTRIIEHLGGLYSTAAALVASAASVAALEAISASSLPCAAPQRPMKPMLAVGDNAAGAPFALRV